MGRVEELQKQKEEIEQQLKQALKEERAQVVEEVKRLCKTFDITATELKGCLKTRKGRKPKAES